MKSILVIASIAFTVNYSYSQNKTTSQNIFYLFDKQDNPVKTIGEASTFEVISKENDTTFIVRYYKNYGPMIWQQTYKDSALTIRHGRFIWYDKDGTIDSVRFFSNGINTGNSFFIDSLAKNKIVNTKEDEIKIGKNKLSFLPDANKDTSIKTIYPLSLAETKTWKRYYKESFDPKIGTMNSVNNTSSNNDAVEVVSFIIKDNEDIDDIYFLHSDAYVYDKEIINALKNFTAYASKRNWPKIETHREIQKIIFTFRFK